MKRKLIRYLNKTVQLILFKSVGEVTVQEEKYFYKK